MSDDRLEFLETVLAARRGRRSMRKALEEDALADTLLGEYFADEIAALEAVAFQILARDDKEGRLSNDPLRLADTFAVLADVAADNVLLTLESRQRLAQEETERTQEVGR